MQGNGLRFGLGALRGVGQAPIEAVIAEREENGEFKDFADFAIRCARHINKRIVESLIYAGAFDCFGHPRAQLAAVYDGVITRVNAMDKQKAGAQISLFGGIIEEQSIEIDYPDIPEYEPTERLSKEKSVLGVYVSGHPFEKYAAYFRDRTFNCSMLTEYTEDEDTGVRNYTEISDGQSVTMGGMISSYKKLQTRSGSFMAFVTVEDLYGTVECVCFPNVYDRIKSFLAPDTVVSLSGKIDIDEEKAPTIIVDRMTEFLPEEGEEKPASSAGHPFPVRPSAPAGTAPGKERALWLKIGGMADEDVEELMETLCSYEGDTPVYFVRDRKKMLCSQRVTPGRALMAELSSFLSDDCIKLV